MEIQINKQPRKIKFSSQLTVGEYIKYYNSLNEESGSYEQLMNYIAVVTGTTYKQVSVVDISDQDILRITAFIGIVPKLEDMEELDSFYYKRAGRTIYKKSLNWRTLGARKMLEEKKLDSALEQAVYLLSCYISKDYDSEKVELIYSELLDYDATLVFGFIVFFFKKLVNGIKPDKNCWLMRKLKAFTNILRLSKK